MYAVILSISNLLSLIETGECNGQISRETGFKGKSSQNTLRLSRQDKFVEATGTMEFDSTSGEDERTDSDEGRMVEY